MTLEQAKTALEKLENLENYLNCLQWTVDIDDEQYKAFGLEVNDSIKEMRGLMRALKDFYGLE